MKENTVKIGSLVVPDRGLNAITATRSAGASEAYLGDPGSAGTYVATHEKKTYIVVSIKLPKTNSASTALYAKALITDGHVLLWVWLTQLVLA